MAKLFSNNATILDYEVGIGTANPASESSEGPILHVHNATNSFVKTYFKPSVSSLESAIRLGGTDVAGGEIGCTRSGDEAFWLDAKHSASHIAFRVNGTERFHVNSSSLYVTNGFMRIGSYIRPDSNGVHDLGLTGDRWEDVWCTQGAFNNSDINLKRDITPSALGLDFINKLNPVSYKWKDVPEVLWTEDDEDFKIMVNAKGIEVGDIKVEAKIHKRTHYGLVAQEVVSTLDELGIDTVDFAAYADGKAKLDSDGNQIGKDGDCALRYTEFISPMIKAIQELSAKVTALENA